MTLDAPTPYAGTLDALEARLRQDLDRLCYPPAAWVPPTSGPSGERVHDAVIIGGGMCGLVAAFALRRLGVADIRILDRSPAGREGPWVTYARMPVLRSPKQLAGPAMGVASLTFRAWYEASFGSAAWEGLDRIPRTQWMDYLVWYRRVLGLPVENGVEVRRIRPEGALLRLETDGAEATVLARKVVLATGRGGLGGAVVPAFLDGAPRRLWAHSSDPIDFAALAGKRVAVVGVGASAMDNAAMALDHGAAEVRVLVRRPDIPRINRLRALESPGFVHGYPGLDDAWRWRIMELWFHGQSPAPRDSLLRVGRHPKAAFHLDCAVEEVREAEGRLSIRTARGPALAADFLILGTGFGVDPRAVPEIAAFAGEIATWEDRYRPPPALANADLARFPYLGRAFEFVERHPGRAPWLANLHAFNYGAMVSLGRVSGDIPAVSEGAAWLAEGIAAALFRADIDRHWRTFAAYDTPELLGDEWRASPLP